MKKLIAVILLSALASIVQASDPVIARYDFGLLRERAAFKVSATVREDGVLKVVARSFARNGEFDPSATGELGQQTFSKKLQKESFEVLKQDLVTLGSAEIEHKLNHIICMIRVSPFMEVDDLLVAKDYQGDDSSVAGPLVLVDGVHGCWVRETVSPLEAYAHQKAHAVKEVLKVLSLELAAGKI